jgi:hypothetical protein
MNGVSTERPRSSSTPITFSHPYVNGALTIDGIYEIQWAYELITSSQATYGGEVIQILGANVGPIQISGKSPHRAEQERIRRWFVSYMQAAGLTRRDQRPVHVAYPERGWEFDIFPVSLPWAVNVENFAPEWSIQAEMAANADGLAAATMSEFTFSSGFLKEFQGIGFSPSMYDQIAFDSQTVGQNFNLLLASWQTGDYQQFGFSPFGNDGVSFDESEVEMYRRYFGSEWLIEPEAGAGEVVGGEPQGKLAIVSQIAQVFEANDVPGALGVAVAIVESGLNPNKRQGDYNDDGDPEGDVGDGAVGLFQTFAVSLAGGGAGAGAAYSKHEIMMAQNAGYGTPVTKHYPASSQIADASQWFKAAASGSSSRDTSMTDTLALARWAQDAQRAGVAYDQVGEGLAKFTTALREAYSLIKEAREVAAQGGGMVADVTETGEALSNAILNHARFNGGDSSNPINDIRNYEAVGVEEKTLKIMLAIMNAGWNIHLSVIKTGHSPGTQHGRGKAFDCNNYGPTGAGSRGPGTSSVDPTAFVSFLKANRSKLGGIHILGGASDETHREWGTDARDQDHHIHISWGSEGF